MTKRERVIAAINFQKTDYIPSEVSFTTPAYEKVLAKMGPDYFATLNSHIDSVELAKPQFEIAPGYTQDEYGVVWNKTGADKDIGVIDNYLFTDWDSYNAYAMPPVDEAFIRRTCENVIALPYDTFKGAHIGFSLFERLWTMMGMENALMNMLLEPELIHRILSDICSRNLAIVDIALEYDLDFIYFGDDWGQQQGLIMGLPHWREFIKPYLTKMYAKVRSRGKYVVQHSCGDNRQIMDDLAEIGLNVYQTFQPEIYGLSYSEKIRGKIAIWGGISTQQDLTKTPEEVRQITRATIDHFKDHGGLIIAPTHCIPGDIPADNIVAMFEVILNQ